MVSRIGPGLPGNYQIQNIGTFIIQIKKTTCSTPFFLSWQCLSALSSFLNQLISSKKYNYYDNNPLYYFYTGIWLPAICFN